MLRVIPPSTFRVVDPEMLETSTSFTPIAANPSRLAGVRAAIAASVSAIITLVPGGVVIGTGS